MIDPKRYTAHLRPGKFQGESPATEYFYELSLEGYGEEPAAEVPEGVCVDLFRVNADEAEAFELVCGPWFVLTESSDGFVFGVCYDSREAAEAAVAKWLGVAL